MLRIMKVRSSWGTETWHTWPQQRMESHARMCVASKTSTQEWSRKGWSKWISRNSLKVVHVHARKSLVIVPKIFWIIIWHGMGDRTWIWTEVGVHPWTVIRG